MRTHLLIAALPLALLPGCSGSSSSAPAFSQPKASAFHPGACRSVADAVRELGRDAHTLNGGAKPDPNMAKRLSDDQDVVFKATGLSPAQKAAFDKLVLAVGVVRIRNDSNTYEKALAADFVKGYEAVVAVCT
ncbi:MAG: hypothetical protein JWO12_1637 [Frankiales bacterium]|nr:hypothetical protein [Frankiales bacterium]